LAASTAGAGHGFNGRIDLGQVDALVATEDREGQVRRAGFISIGESGMAVLLGFEAMWPAILDRVAEPVQRTDAGVPAPGKDQLLGAAGADQLVVDQVRRHPDQRQALAALPDRLMARRMRDQMGKALHRDGAAIAQNRFDSLREGDEFSHLDISSKCALIAQCFDYRTL
jgi:hypothetical protein